MNLSFKQKRGTSFDCTTLTNIYYIDSTIAFVSLAITISSSVGIMYANTLELSVEILTSSDLTSFLAKSKSNPIQAKFSQIFFLILIWFSPIPPVNTIASTPFNDTAYLATNWAIVFVNNSIAILAFGLSSSY